MTTALDPNILFDGLDTLEAASDGNRIREPLTRKAACLAGRAWRHYRRSGAKRSRIIADFLIGAHAQEQAARPLSRDRGFYRKLFPSLTIVDPSTAQEHP